jgi:hypothetical protein
MSDELDNKLLEDRIKVSLDQSAAYLDADTQARLQAIRRTALNQPAKTSWFTLKGWVPAASLAFCSVIAMLLVLPSQYAPTNAADQTAMLELLDNPDELDALSDPDFYMWIDELDMPNAEHHAV